MAPSPTPASGVKVGGGGAGTASSTSTAPWGTRATKMWPQPPHSFVAGPFAATPHSGQALWRAGGVRPAPAARTHSGLRALPPACSSRGREPSHTREASAWFTSLDLFAPLPRSEAWCGAGAAAAG